MATKDYSNAQEEMVSTYLQWDRVAASGGASFVCGDVISDKFLGECKTHIEQGSKIVFRQDVWQKLCDECVSVGRLPVLFVDDGSRKPYNTYCITRKPVDMSILPKNEFYIQDYNVNYKKQLNFDPMKLQRKINKKDNSLFVIRWVEDVLLMGLDTFKEYQQYV